MNTGVFQELAMGKSEKRYYACPVFEVACTRDRFSLFSLQDLGKPL
jgi:hypothetical protein